MPIYAMIRADMRTYSMKILLECGPHWSTVLLYHGWKVDGYGFLDGVYFARFQRFKTFQRCRMEVWHQVTSASSAARMPVSQSAP
jgi:hypothetical protein